MRKVTREALDAFNAGRRYSNRNTAVSVDGDRATLYLHGSAVAQRRGDRVSVSLAGYNTVTTRDRIAAVARHHGSNVYCQNFTAYIAPADGRDPIPMTRRGWHDVRTGEAIK